MEFKSLKHLTEKQKQKAEKITKLLLELKSQGVHPIVIDGGGGDGIQFIRCSKSELQDIGEELLGPSSELKSEIESFIYSPDDYYKITIDYMVP